MHGLPKNCVNCLRGGLSSRPWKVPSHRNTVVPIHLVISLVRSIHFGLPFPLLLVFLDLLVLINMIHQLAHAACKLSSQRLPQLMVRGESELECPYGHIFQILVYLIQHLPIPLR